MFVNDMCMYKCILHNIYKMFMTVSCANCIYDAPGPLSCTRKTRRIKDVFVFVGIQYKVISKI